MPDAAVLLREGVAHHRAGRPAEARRCYGAALAKQPDWPELRHAMGLLAAEARAFGEAVEHFRQALQMRPAAAPVWADLGACLHRQGRLAEAETALRAALRHDPASPQALGTLGLVLAERGGAGAEAEACYRTALGLRPDCAATHANLGNLLREQGRFAEAEAEFHTALALRPAYPDGLHNLGALLAAAGRIAEAEACCLAGLAIAPTHADLRFLLGTTRLLDGRLRAGWEGFGWRRGRRRAAVARDFARPEWDGRDWQPGTLLVYGEEGLGDCIQMLRFVPALAARGRLVLEVPAPLVPLAAGLPELATVVACGETPPDFDCRCALMDLPRLLGIDLAGIPASVPYLTPPPGVAAAWQKRVARLPGRRVGLVWAGNPHYPADARRSLPVAKLAALAGIEGVSFVSLQKPAPAPAPLPLADWTAGLDDLGETAGLIAGLDLVIGVDTAVIHLAGALGVPVWLLNRFDTCWRWMLGREYSPWYPTLRIFRQSAPGDWDGVLARVRSTLAAKAAM
jgi:Flp pilus assembly protein TadD